MHQGRCFQVAWKVGHSDLLAEDNNRAMKRVFVYSFFFWILFELFANRSSSENGTLSFRVRIYGIQVSTVSSNLSGPHQGRLH